MRFLIFLFFISLQSYSQILKDPIAKNWIVEGLSKSYNFQFAEAEEIYNKLKVKYPNSPVYSTLMFMMLYAENAPLNDFPKEKAKYLMHLNKALELSEKLIKNNEHDAEGIFFMLSSLGNLAAWQADNNEMMKAVNTARKAFPYMKKGMKLNDVLSDFLFTSGLYNYYIEQYPQDHPIVKPFTLFFSNGSKKLGISQLELCSRKAIFTANEAAYYSVYIYLKHENKPEKAIVVLNKLLEKFPNNIQYKTRLAESYIALGKYELAQSIVNELVNSPKRVYSITGSIFDGLIDEKFEKNDKEAATKYKKILKIPVDVRFTQDYYAMAYLGLGRIALRANDKALAKAHFKKALELSEYASTTKEVNMYLKGI